MERTENQNQSTTTLTSEEYLYYFRKIALNLSELNRTGVTMIELVQKEEIEKVERVLQDMSCITSFPLKKGMNLVGLALKEEKGKDELEGTQWMKRGIIEYMRENYEEAIESFREALRLGLKDVPLYARLGLSYLKLGEVEPAVTCFRVADGIRKGKDIPFSQWIEAIEQQTSLDENKVNKVMLHNLANGVGYDYEMENLQELGQKIECGSSFQRACQELRMSDEEVQLASLVYAIEHYAQKDFEIGDRYWKMVKDAKGKTPLIQELTEMVRVNRRFYPNKVEDEYCSPILQKKKSMES